VPVFPEILNRLLTFSEPLVISAISVLNDDVSLGLLKVFCWNSIIFTFSAAVENPTFLLGLVLTPYPVFLHP
jgi:hypothetical protein